MNQVRIFIWLLGAIAGFSHAALSTEDKNLIVSAASKREEKKMSHAPIRHAVMTAKQYRRSAIPLARRNLGNY